MAYIGNQKSTATTLSSKTLDTMTGDGSDTTLTLTSTPSSVNNVAVYLDGIMQRPTVNYTLSGNVVTFTTAPANGVVVIALSGGGEHIGSPSAGSVDSDKLPIGAITDAKIATGVAATKLSGTLPALNANAVTNLTSANLTGTFPAISAAALTGVPGAIDTENASDPATNTNPSGGVGHLWLNTTSGELYACTDATAGANVWINVGGGDGNIVPYSFQGTNYGYVYGGTYPTSADVQQFSFTSDGNATDVGNQSVQRQSYTAASSTTHGYCMGGQLGQNVIDKFAFASANGFTMTDVGNLTQSVAYPSGMSTQAYGFRAGGSPNTDTIDRFAFASDGDATDWANLHTARSAASNGISGTTHGYTAGGQSDQIQKFQYSSQATGTDVGNLLNHGGHNSGTWNNQSGATASTTHGYVVGSSMVGVSPSRVIQKFTFSSDANSTNVGNIITPGVFLPGTASATTHGYRAGGDTSGGGTPVDTIDKWANASDGDATDVGNLVHTQNYMGQGSQY